jgi:O-antigen ligase
VAQNVRSQPKTAANVFSAFSLTLAILALNLRLMVSGIAQEGQSPSANKIIELFILLAALLWLLAGISAGKLTLRRSGITVPLLVFTLLVLISVFQASDFAASYRSALTLLFHTIFFFLLFHLCLSEKTERAVLSALLASAAVTCFIAFYQRFYVFNLVRQSYQETPALAMVSDQFRSLFEERLSLNEVWATFFLSNTFCVFLAIILPVPLFLLLSRLKKKTLKAGEVATVAFLSVITLFAIALTGSRGGWLALAAALALTALYSRTLARKKRTLSVASSCIVIACILFLCLFSPLLSWVRVPVVRLADLLWGTRWVSLPMSLCYRLDYWAGTQRMILANPFGVGAANFPDNYPLFKRPYAGEVKLAHNSYLGICAEFGIAALIAFLAIWLAAARQLLKPAPPPLPAAASRDDKPPINEKYIMLLAMAGGVLSFVPFYLLGLFISIPFSTPQEVLCWTALWLVLFLLISRKSAIFASPLLPAALITGLVSFLIHCIVDFDFSSHGVNLTVLTVLAILLARNLRTKGLAQKGYAVKRTVLVPAASLLAAGIALLAIIYLPGNAKADHLRDPRGEAAESQMNAFQVLVGQPSRAKIEGALDYLDKAAKILEEAKAASPGDRKGYMELAGTYEYMFNLSRSLPEDKQDKKRTREYFDKAISNYEGATRLAPLTHTAFYKIALLYTSRSDPLRRIDVEQAFEAANDAVRVYPTKPAYHLLLGDLYRWLYEARHQEADRQKMIFHYSEALKLSRQTPDSRLKIPETEVNEIKQILSGEGK